ncbi:MAG: chemotaxis protein CheW [Gammaproteobacteria bacterium]|nr:chemotaxis protein CheW [Gammaproteobacteria bacterium]
MEKTPILLLHELARRGRERAHGLPQQIEVKATWEGIGFRLDDKGWVVPLEQVKEILSKVKISRIPSAREWVHGVANVRGTLLPILDLKGFLSGRMTAMSRHSRILVMQHKGIVAGLLVEEVIGMRQFLEEEFSADTSDLEVTFGQMLMGQYRQRGESWGVFNINHLAELPEFMHVAA